MRPALRRSALLALVATAPVAVAVTNAPANADHGITTTGSVNVRSGPGTQFPVVDVIPAGVSPDYHCFEIGEDVHGVGVWFDVSYAGSRGFVTSYYDDSSYASGADLTAKYGIPACGEAPSSTEPNFVETDCSGNEYVSAVLVQDYTEGQFDILVYPTAKTRYAQLGGYGQEATWGIWHAVQACVPDLYGDRADGIYQQIECHVLGTLSGPFEAGGDEYGLESWRRVTDWDEMVRSLCNWGGFPYEPIGEPYRTDRAGNNPVY